MNPILDIYKLWQIPEMRPSILLFLAVFVMTVGIVVWVRNKIKKERN